MIDTAHATTVELMKISWNISWELMRRLWWAYAIILSIGLAMLMLPMIKTILRNTRRKKP